MLPKEKIDFFLDNNNIFDDFLVFDDMKLKYHEVSSLVNSPNNNNESCVNPIY